MVNRDHVKDVLRQTLEGQIVDEVVAARLGARLQERQAPRYWEAVRNEMADVFEEPGGWARTWEGARKEAILRLYIRGIFQEMI